MRKIMVLLAVVGIVMAGCGSSDKKTTAGAGSSSGSTSKAPVALPGKTNDEGDRGDATSGTLEVELEDFYINPTFTKAKPGAKVKLSLKNTGSTPHTFTSTALGVDETLQPGASKDVDVTMPASGATEYHCRFHQSSGMQGAFFFNEGDAVAAGGGPGASGSSESSTPYNN